ncbi:MAG: aldehyde dehydrogenase family protein [Bacteroidetes bacterium]|nr:aldehyde dehydrogenase family protein [Bacteroidota bacterium]
MNEPILQYAPGSNERSEVISELSRINSEQIEIPLIIRGKENKTGKIGSVCKDEIDAASELIDYLRFNVYFGPQIYGEQPKLDFDQLNRMEYRPLEGFIFTVTPFNFTAVASNLNMSVSLMGNTTVWKPTSTSLLSNYYLMKIFQEAGLPAGVINFIPGSGSLIGGTVLKNKDLAGIHFTGSNSTFVNLWRGVSENIMHYVSFPKLEGETGGKNFIFVHNSTNPI